MAALPRQVAHAKANAPGFTRILEKVSPGRYARERRSPRCGDAQVGPRRAGRQSCGRSGLNATPVAKLAKIFMSPGPVYEPEGRASDWWRTARALYAGGFRAGDLIANTFAYHFTPAGSMLESGALAIGCTVSRPGPARPSWQVAACATSALLAISARPRFSS